MDVTKCKPGRKVEDRWYPEWGHGRVLKVTASSATVKFPGRPAGNDTLVYDKAHAKRFLKVLGK